MEPHLLEQEIDQSYLTDLVQKALDQPLLQVTEWDSRPITTGVGFDSTVFRINGMAREAAGESIPWSLILKIARPSEKAADPAGIWYWKREPLAFQSGLLNNLPGGNVSGPACYEVEERPDGNLWIWMEVVKDEAPAPWSIEQYALAARHLGQFNGAYLTGHPFPSEPWIARDWLRKYVENAAKMIEFVRGNPGHPMIRHMFPGIVLAQILAVWDERERILDVLDHLPQVFCHQDAFKRNLFARNGRTIAIDWGYMGITPVGAELVPLVAASLGFFEIPVEKVMDLDRQCFEGYLQGLRDAGWEGDPKLVRTGYTVSLMLRYPVGGQVGEIVPKMLDQEGRSRMEAAFENKSADELEKSDPAIVAYYQSLLPEAMRLIGMTNLLRVVGRIGLNTLRVKATRKA